MARDRRSRAQTTNVRRGYMMSRIQADRCRRRSLACTVMRLTMIAAVAATAFAREAPAHAAASGVILGDSGKCVDVTGGSSANGTRIQLLTCNGGAAQQWTL